MKWDEIQTLFHEALRDRSVLDNADPELKKEVESLLAAHEVAPEEPVPEGPGTVIGHYKLLQEIGEGGFGVVYMAEQTEPVRRKVALKIIKLGMDTKNVIARFEAERQALALMDHPNIAKVLDAGATDTGRPFFVMELVKGIPITEYCDQAQLDTPERLALMQDVCHAVQHAHQKGIIHRDLKPSNVLVTLHDGVPVPKVIDFGIAKATDHHLTEKTLFTEFRQMIGTPDYMAPEQAEMSGLDVDTRADVYSLGVMTYELLTGSKPFDMKALLQQGYEEIVRTIREVDPPKPSTRLSTMGEFLQTVAKQRHTPPALLGKLLRGDLDWIIMKALEKDRSRRYETATALARDIQRYLDDEPVSASSPGPAYRARKYLRRHRIGVTALIVIVAGLIVGGGLAYAGKRSAESETKLANDATSRAVREAEAARAAETAENEQTARAEAGAVAARRETVRAETVLQFVEQLLAAADPGQVKGRNYKVRQLLDDFDRELRDQLKDQPDVEATVRATMGNAYLALGIAGKAEPQVKAALEIRRRVLGESHPQYAESLRDWAGILHYHGRYRESERTLHRAIEIGRAARGDDGFVASTLSDLASCERALGRYADAEQHARQGLALQRKVRGDRHPEVAESLDVLSSVLLARAAFSDAEKYQREAIAVLRQTFGGGNARTAAALQNLAVILMSRGRYGEAEAALADARTITLAVLGEEHPTMGAILTALGLLREKQADCEGAIPLLERALAIMRKAHGDYHPTVGAMLNNLAVPHFSMGAFERAEELLREDCEITRRALGDAHPELGPSLVNLAMVRSARGDQAGAEKLLQQSLSLQRRALGESHPGVAETLLGLARVRDVLRDHAGAEGFVRQAQEILRRTPGGIPGLEALALFFLSRSASERGDFTESERLCSEALAIRTRLYGEEHPLTNSARAQLADVLLAKRDFAGAERLFEQAMTNYRKVFGAGHPHMVFALDGLADLMHQQGKLAESETHYRRALEICVEFYGERHAQTSRERFALAVVLFEQGEFRRAAEVLREHVKYERSHGCLAALGSCLLHLQKPAEAEPLLRECLEKRRKEIPGSWLYYNAMSLLGEALAAQKKYAEAEPLLLEGYEKMQPPPQLANRKQEALDRIVKLYEAWGKPDKAEEWRAKGSKQ